MRRRRALRAEMHRIEPTEHSFMNTEIFDLGDAIKATQEPSPPIRLENPAGELGHW